MKLILTIILLTSLCWSIGAQGLSNELLQVLPQNIRAIANQHSLLDEGFIDVTKPPYNAMPNDEISDFSAINTAIKDAYHARMSVFIPEGTYFVDSAFRCEMDVLGPNDGRRLYSFMIVGSALGKKPIIKLIDNSSLKNDILFFFQSYKNGKAQDPSNYAHLLRNIHIDMGNNPNSIAVSMSGAQLCSIEDVSVSGEKFNAGFINLPGSGGSSTNIQVEGGDYGIIQKQYRPNPLVTGLRLINQRKGAIRIESARGPLDVAGFEIVGPSNSSNYIAVESTAGGNISGNIALKDGSIECKETQQLALKNFKCDVNLKNVSIKSHRLSQFGVEKFDIGNRSLTSWKHLNNFAYSTETNPSSISI